MIFEKKLAGIDDVVAYQHCTGCGACAYVRPDDLEMVDSLEFGRRPRPLPNARPEAMIEALEVCPGVGLTHPPAEAGAEAPIAELRPGWGPVYALWEGHASDPEIRFEASSGGVATALSLFCLEQRGMHGVLHIRSRSDAPVLNETVLSRTREELLAAAGSRYAPASPCDGLAQVEAAPAPCVFIGKPCDAAAVVAARRSRPALDEKLGLSIAMFCAGTPSTGATMRMLEKMGVRDVRDVVELRYRGRGWPGDATVKFRSEEGLQTRTLSYDESWGAILQEGRQWRCYVCADHTGEFADVAVGDPWHRPPDGDDPGRSLVLARTPRGREIVEQAIAAGYLTLTPTTPNSLPDSQPGLLRVRGSVWGRTLMTRLLGAAAPRYRGLPTFRFWLSSLSLRQKLQSTVGTARRVFRKGLRRRVEVIPYVPPPPKS